GHSPTRILGWVHDNVRFVPTYGSVQGAELTLLNKQGNAFDTASLLIALLRASNIPARYVFGTVQVPADRAKAWVGGVPTMQAAQELLGTGGVPNVALLQGGFVSHLRLEHVWVEAFVDFEPSRGEVHKQGDTWVPMDGSYKQHQRVPGLDLRSLVSVDMGEMVRNSYAAAQVDAEGGITELHPGYLEEKGLADAKEALRQLQEKLPGLSAEQLAGTVRIAPREGVALEASLPYEVVARGASASALPAGMRHAVSLRMYASALDRAMESPDLQVTLSLPRLNSRRLSITYTPASDADAQLIQSYVDSGSDSLPVYLVRVVPRVQLDGVTLASGAAVTMGTQQSWELALSGPNEPGSQPDVYDITAGSESVFGIDGNGLNREVVQARYDAVPSDTVAENMHQVALRFFHQHDYFDELVARQRNVFKQRLPSAGHFSYPLEVRYLFGMPRWGSYAGRMMDVKRVLLAVSAESSQARFDYMSQVGMQGSYLEGSVLDQVFSRMQGTGISSAQVLMDAAEAQIPIYHVDATNAATVLPRVSLSSAARAEINSAVASGKTVLLPQYAPREVMGYVIQDPHTGAAAYLIDGGLSGGIGKECNRSPQPEPVRVPQLSPLQLLFLVLAILAILALIFTPAGGIAVGVARVVFAAVFALILGAAPAYAAEPRVCCVPKPIPHLGGNAVHDTCADVVPPNVHPGFDV
ncbi:MAG TPA: transglutaminase domain-containing protein, partial [Aggregicoccus sp.]|nr:transglutaminase domain-containing protein [Aggregicoccus sp.]